MVVSRHRPALDGRISSRTSRTRSTGAEYLRPASATGTSMIRTHRPSVSGRGGARLGFRAVGPERFEMVAGVNASLKRIAAGFGVAEQQVLPEYQRRLQQKQLVVEIPSGEAPVHQVVLTGDQIDLTRMPFDLQHEFDGAPYISAAMDFAIDPATNQPNVGCRRSMLRSRNTLRSNLTQPSDLRRIYIACAERKQRLPVSFVIGAHPCRLPRRDVESAD